jgi:hypothetical protein
MCVLQNTGIFYCPRAPHSSGSVIVKEACISSMFPLQFNFNFLHFKLLTTSFSRLHAFCKYCSTSNRPRLEILAISPQTFLLLQCRLYTESSIPTNNIWKLYTQILISACCRVFIYLLFTTPTCTGHEFWPLSGSYKLVRHIQLTWQLSDM